MPAPAIVKSTSLASRSGVNTPSPRTSTHRIISGNVAPSDVACAPRKLLPIHPLLIATISALLVPVVMNSYSTTDPRSAPQPNAPEHQTILLVENNDDDAQLLRLMFRRSRILNPLQVVTSITDAKLYLMGEIPFADRDAFPFPLLLIVDDGSGFDLLRWLQAHDPRRPAAVVMLTGSDLGAFKRSYDLGAQSFLTKPLKFDDFQNMVRHVRGIKLTTTPEGHLLEFD